MSSRSYLPGSAGPRVGPVRPWPEANGATAGGLLQSTGQEVLKVLVLQDGDTFTP